jgi:hypothetical protein
MSFPTAGDFELTKRGGFRFAVFPINAVVYYKTEREARAAALAQCAKNKVRVQVAELIACADHEVAIIEL